MGHKCITAVSAVNIYVCFMGKQNITETQLQSCLPRQHVLRYKYFHSFSSGYSSSAFWVQWEIYSVMFGSNCIFWGWCHEKQDAQVLPCLSNLSRFYCHAPHQGIQVLPKPSDLQRQGQGRHCALCFLGMLAEPFALYFGRVFPDTAGVFCCLGSEVEFFNHLKSCWQNDLEENCLRYCTWGMTQW